MSHIRRDSHPQSPSTPGDPVMVLLVEARHGVARRLEETLHDAGKGLFKVVWVSRLPKALERLTQGDIEVVLACTQRPPPCAPDAFKQLQQAAPGALVLPLEAMRTTASHGEEMGQYTPGMDWLPGALQYVARRKATETAWRMADEALFEEKERARVTLSSIGDAVLVTDTQGKVTYLNQVAESLTGWPVGQATGRHLEEVFNIFDSDTGKRARSPASHAMEENTTVGLAANCMLHRLDGSEIGIEDSAAPIHDLNGQVSGAVIVFRDVNHSRAMTSKMAWLASHDSLTGAASRVLLEARFKQVTSLANRHARQAAILFVDLDNFKQINDGMGHSTGDRVLQTVAGNLMRGVRDSDTVSRHGGDEFVILLAEVASPAAAKLAAAKLLTLFRKPLSINGHNVKVAMSIGISMYPGDGKDMRSLIEHADSAMYNAKAKGANSYGLFTSAENGKMVSVGMDASASRER